MKGIILTALLTLSIVFKANACACEKLKLKDAYNKSELIFTGKLIDKEIKITEIKAPKIDLKQKYVITVYTFEIIEFIKGVKNVKTIKINTRYNNIDFVNGEKYLIYSYYSEYLLTSNFYINGEKVNPFLATDSCTNTKNLANVERKEIKKLKKFARRESHI